MRFFHFFFNQMTQKYQNEKSPILNGQKKFKTSEKVQKLRDLEGPTSFRPFENTLYMNTLYIDVLKALCVVDNCRRMCCDGVARCGHIRLETPFNQ